MSLLVLVSLMALFYTFSPFCSIFPISEPSRLILHFATPSPLHDLVLTPRLSPMLAHIIAHPPALLVHLATEQLMPPPPASTPDRFWPVFAPLSARTWEVERIVLGPGCVGLSDEEETVLQVITRGRGKNVERELDGWTADGPCALTELDSLKGILEDSKGKPEWAEVSQATPRVLRGVTCFE
jgi:elongator complex protein 5